MLEKFILEQLERTEAEKKELVMELNKLVTEEEMESRRVSELLEQEDVGIELFSPRNPETKITPQITEIRKKIEDVKYKQTVISDKLDQNGLNETKWQKLLLEARSPELKQEEACLEAEKGQNSHLEDLKTIMERLNQGMIFMDTDVNRSKVELNNLKYYLKALISRSIGEEG